MCTVRFIGCLHFGHKNMAQHRGFQDEFYHDEHIIDNWNRVVSKRDLTYIVGDITMETDKHYCQLDRLNGRKVVILGNHALPKHVKALLEYVESVAGALDYKGFRVTHIPIHPDEIGMCRGNIHAHIHENILEDVQARLVYNDDTNRHSTISKYYNVDAKNIQYTPKTVEELLKDELSQ